MSTFFQSIALAAQGLRAQSGRMRIVAENIANADSAPTRAGEEPYRRKIATFERRYDAAAQAPGVALGRTRADASAFRPRYEPGHPAADANGFVSMPNVDTLIEQADMREAQRSYEANVNVISATRRMIARTLDILKI